MRTGTDPDQARVGRVTVTTGTDRRWQMTTRTTARDSQAVTSRGTEHLLHESAACHKTDQISSSHQWRYVVRWHNRQCVTWSVSRGSEDTLLGSREQSAGSAGSTVASWRRIQTLTGEANKPLDDRCQPKSSREADTASRCGPRNSKSAESELYAAVNTAS